MNGPPFSLRHNSCSTNELSPCSRLNSHIGIVRKFPVAAREAAGEMDVTVYRLIACVEESSLVSRAEKPGNVAFRSLFLQTAGGRAEGVTERKGQSGRGHPLSDTKEMWVALNSGRHYCDAVRSRVFHLLSDRMTMEGWFPLGCDGSRLECPRTEQLEQSLGKAKSQAAPTLWLIALVSLTTGDSGPGTWGHPNRGTSLSDRSFADLPPSSPQERAVGLRRGLCGL